MRWSASKLARDCAHHHILSELHPRPRRDAAAKLGTAFHLALADWHRTGIVPAMDGDLGTWLQTMVDHGWAWPDRCEVEIAWGLSQRGTFVAVKEPQPHIYESLDGEELLTAGRADACWLAGDVLTVVDFKTGRTLAPPARINLQVNAAGIALAQKWKSRAYIPCLYYAREGRWDVGDETELPGEAHGILTDIQAAAALDGEPHPGPWCGDCWERKHCPAGRPGESE